MAVYMVMLNGISLPAAEIHVQLNCFLSGNYGRL